MTLGGDRCKSQRPFLENAFLLDRKVKDPEKRRLFEFIAKMQHKATVALDLEFSKILEEEFEETLEGDK